jgi:hypothetical protein
MQCHGIRESQQGVVLPVRDSINGAGEKRKDQLQSEASLRQRELYERLQAVKGANGDASQSRSSIPNPSGGPVCVYSYAVLRLTAVPAIDDRCGRPPGVWRSPSSIRHIHSCSDGPVESR